MAQLVENLQPKEMLELKRYAAPTGHTRKKSPHPVGI